MISLFEFMTSRFIILQPVSLSLTRNTIIMPRAPAKKVYQFRCDTGMSFMVEPATARRRTVRQRRVRIPTHSLPESVTDILMQVASDYHEAYDGKWLDGSPTTVERVYEKMTENDYVNFKVGYGEIFKTRTKGDGAISDPVKVSNASFFDKEEFTCLILDFTIRPYSGDGLESDSGTPIPPGIAFTVTRMLYTDSKISGSTTQTTAESWGMDVMDES